MRGGGLASAADAAETPVAPKFAARIAFDGLVPYHQARKAILDAQGRTRVIVDFMNGAQDAFLEAASEDVKRFVPGRDRHNPIALRLIEDYERRFGIEPVFSTNAKGVSERSNLTTWVGASLTAYLTSEQIDGLRRDKNVRLVTQDGPIKFSTPPPPPPWGPTWNGPAWGELNDWGWNAVQGKAKLPGSTRKVYIIDSGVAFHSDLSSVIDRRNVLSGDFAGAKHLVGCYAHATHVAGIVGATENNDRNRRGVYAGVDMVSLAITTDISQVADCNSFNGHGRAGIGIALDLIFSEGIAVDSSPQLKPHIVNLSANPTTNTGFDSNGVAGTNQQKIVSLISPSWVFPPQWSPVRHPGHVFVQSAGNQYENVCSDTASKVFKTAWNASNTAVDGAIVVGALNAQGNPVGGANGAFGAAYPAFSDINVFPPSTAVTVAGEVGSNYGLCVDMWAPGDSIYSTWGKGWESTKQSDSFFGGQPESCAFGGCVSIPHRGWAWLSGTSMAAPHVAAAAAYVADLYGLTTPAAIEQKLRDTWHTLTAVDAANTPVHMVWLQ